jgi:CxxC motif-containing protein (DUF1111 family)
MEVHMRLLRVLGWTALGAALLMPAVSSQSVTEAPAGFDGATNGFVDQATFDADRAIFEQARTIADGLGPVYNARSCVECHQNPLTGGPSQVNNLRAGQFNGSAFINHVGGSLIADRAIDAAFQERVFGGNNTRAFRASLSTLGAGFVESIANDTLIAIRNAQPAAMRGTYIYVPVTEASGTTRVGRFGWKNQHASLLSMAAEEFLNQVGVTGPLYPTENTSNGTSVAAIDTVADPEDATGAAVAAFVEYIRSTKVPPRGAITTAVTAGNVTFISIGCAVCHVTAINTAAPGTIINGGAFIVPEALGNKRIRPYSDFLLHDVGTGDGIVQNGGQPTRNQVRTPPLWGMRTRARLMHDGLSLTRNEAILRHAGQATGVINNYRALSLTQQNDLITFLNSL